MLYSRVLSYFIIALFAMTGLLNAAFAEPSRPRRVPIGTNLRKLGSLVTQWDFTDAMKGSNPWVYGSGPDKGKRVLVDSLGNPLLGPQDSAHTLLRLRVDDRWPSYPLGTYTFTWDGSGELFVLTGTGAHVINASGSGSRKIETGPDTTKNIFLRINSVQADDPLRNIRAFMPGYGPDEPLDGQRFHELFLERTTEPFGTIRFMEWMRANDSKVEKWNDRTRDGVNQYTVNTGVPVEELVRLANTNKSDAWFSMPARADDEYVRHFAKYVRNNLDPSQMIFVEYANEVWNGQFEGFKYVTEQAIANGLTPGGLDQDFAKQWASEAIQDFDVWLDVFEGQEHRIKRVAASQAVNRFVSPILLREMYRGGKRQFDVLSMAHYVGVDMRHYNANTTADKILDDLFESLESKVDPTITKFLPGSPFEVIAPAGDWLWHRQMADEHGVPLIAYEAGQGLTSDNNRSVPWYDAYVEAVRSPRMYEFYTAFFETMFKKVRADGLNIFSSVSEINQWGAWGHLEYQDQPLAEAHRYRAVIDFLRGFGDFNQNGLFDPPDVDTLFSSVGMKGEPGFVDVDLVEDGVVDQKDIDFWVHERARTNFGDTNLDGDIDFRDFTVLTTNTSGQIEPSPWSPRRTRPRSFAITPGQIEPLPWAKGNTDGDNDIDVDDFLTLATNFTGSRDPLSSDVILNGEAELKVNLRTGKITMIVDNDDMLGYSIRSSSGSLVPDPYVKVGESDPLAFRYLFNERTEVSAGNLYPLQIEGSTVLGASFPIGGRKDLWFEYATTTGLVMSGSSQVTYIKGTGVTARHIFYNHSVFDDSNDDDAIAFDKLALRPGQTATFGHYTSFVNGINGIMVDILNLVGDPTVDDFEFRVGNDNSPVGWAFAPEPTSLTVRDGEGIGGSDRVTIIWPDKAIANQWLQIKVLATAATGLSEPDLFFFGNAIGESGDGLFVGGNDFAGTRDNQHDFSNLALITDAYDFNRDSFVDGIDLSITRDHSNNFLTALQLITPLYNVALSARVIPEPSTFVLLLAATMVLSNTRNWMKSPHSF